MRRRYVKKKSRRTSQSFKRKHLLLSSALTLVGIRVAAGNSETYTGPDDGNFSSSANWNTAVAPNSGDDVYLGVNDGTNTNFNVNFDYQSSSYSGGGFDSLTIDSPSSGKDITVSEVQTGMTVDSLSAATLVIGNSNEGQFIQGGTSSSSNTISGDLILGNAADSSGEYDLGGNGSLSVSQLTVGDGGNGTFVQSSGTSAIIEFIAIGESTNANGTYTLNGGTLSSDAETYGVSPNSTGAFVQNGGVHTITGNMVVGELPSSSVSTYTLQTGSLSVGGETIGFGGTGEFTQYAGTNSVAGNLIVGTQYDYLFVPIIGNGSFTLGGGAVSAASMSVGVSGIGNFTQSNGTVIVGSVTIQTNGGTGNLSQSGGTFTAASAANDGTINQTGGTANLGQVTGTGSIQIGSSTNGNPHLTVASISQGSVSVTSNGTLTISPNSPSTNVLGSLTILGTGTLNITNNKLFIDYGKGPDPIASIQQWIHNGYYDVPGTPSIISSAVATDDALSGLSYGIGYADGADGAVAGLPSGEIEIIFTLLGDSNLDGTVNAEDFTPFSHNLGQSGTMWDDGDFNYDGTVNAEDFTLFSHNIGQSATLAAQAGALEVADGVNMANVPEPASAGMMMVTAGLGIFRRRRRSSR